MSLFDDEIGEDTQKRDEVSKELFWVGASPPKKHSGVKLAALVFGILVCLCAAFAVTLNFVLGNGWLSNALKNDNGVKLSISSQKKPAVSDEYKREDGRYTVEGVVQTATPSIVSITGFKDNDSSEELYTYAGQGSGVIFTSDGYIITNAHVIASATKGIRVTDYEGESYEAKLIGSDEESDIAVLKVSGSFTPVTIGDSTETKLGEEVVAIGNPGGYGWTVTSGVVSGTDRMVRGGNQGLRMSCLQVDAAINPGSSGGALINMWGQLIGITSSKLSNTKYEGIGFAISTNAVIPIVESIIENGYAEKRPRLGISYYAVSKIQAETYGTKAGLVIQDVEKSSDAAKYLKAGDIIVELDGKQVDAIDDVVKIMESKKAGQTLKIKYVRYSDGKNEETLEAECELMNDIGSDFEEQ